MERKIPAPDIFKSEGTSEARKTGSQPHHPSTPWVPPSVAAQPPSFPQSAARNLLFPMQHTLSISECSLKTDLQGLPQHPQKVCRPGAKIKQELLLEVAWPGHHFSVLLLKLMLLPLALVTFGAPRRLLWPWKEKVSPCGFLGHRLSKKRCNVVMRVLLFTSPLSPCCFLALSVVPAIPPVPARAVPPWPSSAQLGRAAGVVGAGCGGSPRASCVLTQEGLRRLPHLLERRRVCRFTRGVWLAALTAAPKPCGSVLSSPRAPVGG